MTSADRIDALEREVKLFRGCVLMGLLAVILSALLGAVKDTPPEKVDASQVRIIDQHGNARMTLGVDDNQPVIAFLGEEGRTILRLRTTEGRGDLVFLDKTGTPRIELALTKNGPVLNFIGENSAIRATLSGAGDQSKLELFESQGRQTLSARNGELTFVDATGAVTRFP